jgi:hypothetical protein
MPTKPALGSSVFPGNLELLAYYLMQEGSGGTWNSATGAYHAARASVSTDGWITGPDNGPAVPLASADGGVVASFPAPSSNYWNTTDWTVAAHVRVKSANPSGLTRILAVQVGTITPYFGLVLYDNKIGLLSSPEAVVGSPGYGSALNDDTWHTLVVSRDTVNDVFSFYVDGSLVTTVATTNNSGIGNFSTFAPVIGGRTSSAERISADINWGAIWHRALTGAEVTALTSNPYDLFGGSAGTKPAFGASLNTGHALYTGLKSFHLMAAGSGSTLTDSTGSHNATRSGLPSAINRWLSSGGPHGGYAYQMESGDPATVFTVASDDANWTVDDFSIMALAKLASGHGTGTERVFSVQHSNGSAPYWGMVVKTNKVTALSSNDSIVYPGGYGASGLNDDAWHVLHVNRKKGVEFTYWVDGVKVQTTSIANTATMDVAFNPVIGGWKEGSEEFTGKLDCLAVWRCSLSDAEIAAVAADPYLPFTQVVGIGGGGGVSNTRRRAQIIG